MQVFRQLVRGHQVFLRVVEAAAVHGPQFAGDAGLGQRAAGLGRPDRVVQPDKVKRSADPRYAGDQMQPAHQQIEPLHPIRSE
ncbi:hypothetical protein D3C72_2193920 [compost metagenome]